MSFGYETKKQLGTFYHERGQIVVNLVIEEREVYIGTGKQKFHLPVSIELNCNGMEMRVKAADVRGFIGLLTGHVEEFCRSRETVLRLLEKFNVNVEEMP